VGAATAGGVIGGLLFVAVATAGVFYIRSRGAASRMFTTPRSPMTDMLAAQRAQQLKQGFGSVIIQNPASGY